MDHASLRACAKAFRKLIASNAAVLVEAFYVEVNLLDREHADRWTVVGGPRTLLAKFRAVAARAAVAAGVAGASWSEQAKLEAWLDFLVRKTQGRVGDGDILPRRIHVSVDVCDRLASELPSKPDQQSVPAWNPRAYPQTVTQALKEDRRALLANFREEHGDMKMEGLAEYTGMSVSAIYGAVDENKNKCSRPKRNRMIKKLGISVEKWYGR